MICDNPKARLTVMLCLLSMAAAGCASPTPPSTPTPIPETATPAPTATPSIPTINVDGVEVPDPKVTNPELFDLSNPDSPIVEFANAFGVQPQDVGKLGPELRTSLDGKPFVVLTTADLAATGNFDEAGIALIMAQQSETGGWLWGRATLRGMGDKVGMPIGSLINLDLETPKSLAIAKREFSVFMQITVGWIVREKRQGHLDFSWPDRQLRFANENKMMPIAQHLVFTEELPDWLKKGTFTSEQLADLLRNHIHDTMVHFPDVPVWSVVNEAWFYSRYSPSVEGSDFWYSKLGKDYVRLAFEAAREANPSAILCYSDLQNEIPSDRATMNREIVETLKRDGLIDGLMMHMRIDAAKPPIKPDLIAMMRSYDLPIYITELTVDLTNVKGTQQERFLKQAEVYETIMEAALESGVTKSFVMWGFGDSENWLEMTVGRRNADPTIYTDDYSPKPAYYALLQAMLKYAGTP